jgi:hypothetical protein
MQIDLRELIVYQSPPELGALWSDVNNMMVELGKQQEVHLKRKIRAEAEASRRRERFMRALKADAYLGGFFLFILFFSACMMALIARDAEHRHPEWKSHKEQATLEIIRRQEIARVLEEANTKADIRYKQLMDASRSDVKVHNRESDAGGE